MDSSFGVCTHAHSSSAWAASETAVLGGLAATVAGAHARAHAGQRTSREHNVHTRACSRTHDKQTPHRRDLKYRTEVYANTRVLMLLLVDRGESPRTCGARRLLIC